VTHGKAAGLRFFTSQRDNLNYLLRAELRCDTAAITITKRPNDQRFQLSIRRTFRFGIRQTILNSKPPSSPPADALRIHTKPLGLVQIQPARGRTQDDSGTFNQLLGSLVGTHHRSQKSTNSL